MLPRRPSVAKIGKYIGQVKAFQTRKITIANL